MSATYSEVKRAIKRDNKKYKRRLQAVLKMSLQEYSEKESAEKKSAASAPAVSAAAAAASPIAPASAAAAAAAAPIAPLYFSAAPTFKQLKEEQEKINKAIQDERDAWELEMAMKLSVEFHDARPAAAIAPGGPRLSAT